MDVDPQPDIGACRRLWAGVAYAAINDYRNEYHRAKLIEDLRRNRIADLHRQLEAGTITRGEHRFGIAHMDARMEDPNSVLERAARYFRSKDWATVLSLAGIGDHGNINRHLAMITEATEAWKARLGIGKEHRSKPADNAATA